MLRNLLSTALLGAAFSLLAACTRSEQAATAATTTTCPEAGSPVRTVTDVPGTVTFDKALQRYKIMAPEPGTVDVVQMGIVCGTLPEALRAEGSKVVFSGTFKTYPNPPAAPAGYTTYYLELSAVKAQ